MQITNLEKTGKIIKHLSKKGTVQADIIKVEGKAVQFSPDGIVTVEVQIDSNKNRIKAGDKVSITVENGTIELVERAPKVKEEKGAVAKAADAVKKAFTPKESASRGCARGCDIRNM